MKAIIFSIFVFWLIFGIFNFASAQGVEVDFFYSPTCPHCAKEKIFLRGLEEKYPDLIVNQYDVVNSQKNRKLLSEFYEKYDVSKSFQGLVPATFTPNKHFIGFDEKVAKELESCLRECLAPGGQGLSLSNASIIEKSVKIPLLGEIKLGRLSFPAMAVALGALDGFNVCSLGALILILSLVLAFKSRRKTFIFGGIFLITTAATYGFLIFFWYKLFEAVAPYLSIMNVIIGVFGVSGGVYFLRQFLRTRKNPLVCDSEGGGKVSSKFLPKLQKLLSSPSSIFLAAAAVFAFAFILTVVEFPCSAVVPVAFAAVLSHAGLSPVLYVLYIAIYVLFYLLDEIIVFLIAFFTSKIWLSQPRFFKWIILLEAIILFAIGFYYLSSLLLTN